MDKEKIIKVEPAAPDHDGVENERYYTRSLTFTTTKGTFKVGDLVMVDEGRGQWSFIS